MLTFKQWLTEQPQMTALAKTAPRSKRNALARIEAMLETLVLRSENNAERD